MSHSQRALITIIDEGTSAIKKAQSQMDAGTTLPQLGDDAVSHYVIKKITIISVVHKTHYPRGPGWPSLLAQQLDSIVNDAVSHYSEICLNRTSLRTAFVFRIDRRSFIRVNFTKISYIGTNHSALRSKTSE